MTPRGARAGVRRIIRAYDDPVVRAYCWLRFGILRQRFLDEIGQYLPESGPVLDIGCGFGLFSLYFALAAPGRFVHGVDVSARRIALARRAASRLGVGNVAYEVGDARDFKGDGDVVAAYMLDIVHHIPPAAVPSLLRRLHRSLGPAGTLVVKDVDARPAAKRWFTWMLDKAMAPATPVHYWAADELTALLEATGFRVRRHLMVDVLPYPHVLYACEKRADALEKRADAPEKRADAPEKRADGPERRS
jgi:2-polyprenyl-3-methyl-5-hydroxy-6-metoxy-1,4-benzoquinol methylase